MAWTRALRQKVLTHYGALGATTLTLAGCFAVNQTAFCDSKERKVFSWGSGQYSQLGVGHERDENRPREVQVLTPKNVSFISAGAYQTAAITGNGEVYTFGRAENARLGHGDSGGVNEGYPRLVEELVGYNIVNISGGFVHMAACTDQGELWTWGRNSCGQLGRPNSDYPGIVRLKEKIVQVSCGRNHTLALTDEGKVISFGGLKDGCTGHGTKKGNKTPLLIQELANKTIVQIAAGQDFSIFLDSEGVVSTCGASDFGQTGHGRGARYVTVPTPVKGLAGRKVMKIAAGQYHVLALTDSGEVYSWGFNKDGQLGHNDNFHRSQPAKLSTLENKTVKDIAAGHGHSCIITSDNTVYMFGRGRSGQLGMGDKVASVAAYRPVPEEVTFLRDMNVLQISLGADHSTALCES